MRLLLVEEDALLGDGIQAGFKLASADRWGDC